ncbi:hypothetical protein BDZ88DRAFT_454961 [Geranomyces variabilis]|nr:hypothetical protein BDZ88DRAFT_454961 [Geranomyces variabilis]
MVDSFKRNASISLAAGPALPPHYPPLYQVALAVLAEASKSGDDRGPCVALLYANHAEGDIMLGKELRAMAKEHPTRFRLLYTVSETPEHGDWTHGDGHYKL